MNDATEETQTIQTAEVWLRAERHDGNDPIEATIHLPLIPRKGDQIAVWDSHAAYGGEVVLEVEAVVLNAYSPDAIEVWVRMDGYDLEALEAAMSAARRNDRP